MTEAGDVTSAPDVTGAADVLVVCPGDPAHGVVEHSAVLARAAGTRLHTAALPLAGPSTHVDARLVHLGFTDRLYGRRADEAVDRVLGFADSLRAAGTSWTVTLHDLPQPSDGPGAFERRSEAYRRLADAADGVVVATGHEAELLARTGSRARPEVVPLPIPDLGHAGRGDTGATAADADPLWVLPHGLDRAAVVFGFLYPGKGHVEAVQVLGTLADPPRFVALGACSDGHEDLADELRRQGAELAVPVTVTGRVPASEVPACLHRAAVPLAPHRHVSASGSIAAWIGAGRRPLVTAGGHADELLDRWPGCVTPVADDDWPRAIAEALADPASTRLAAPVQWSPAEVADAYRNVWAGVLA